MNNMNPMLQPLTYHVELRDYLKIQERDLWDWFSSAEARANYAESLHSELLETASPLPRERHEDLYRLAEEAKVGLQLDVPLIIYQARQSEHLNAALFYLPQEAHLMLSGPVLSLLSPGELKSILGYALAHFHLWQCEGGEFLVAERLLKAMSQSPRADSSHIQSARRYRLYTEIHGDRCALQLIGDLHTVVAGLVKMQTGQAEVSGTSFLEQSREIFQKSNLKMVEISHPETYLRARALALWAEGSGNIDRQIRAMIEGGATLDELDLTSQWRLSQLTQRLLAQFLRPKWFQTEAVLAHARRFFADFKSAPAENSGPVEDMKSLEESWREYLCYLLLDFVAVDPTLNELPLAAALEFSRQLGIDALFESLAMKELQLKLRDLKRLKEEAGQSLLKAEATR